MKMESEASIADQGLVTVIQSQMRAAGLTWLRFEAHSDKQVGHLKLAVFQATIREPGGAVADVWLVSGGPSGRDHPYAGRYNAENYPGLIDAIGQHVGRLVLEGLVTLVNPDDGIH